MPTVRPIRPKVEQCAPLPIERILSRPGNSPKPAPRVGEVEAGCINVVAFLPEWVGPDDAEVRTGREASVPGPRREDQNIPASDFEFTSLGAAQHQLGLAIDDAQHLMSIGVEVVVPEYPVGPHASPFVRPELEAKMILEVVCVGCAAI